MSLLKLRASWVLFRSIPCRRCSLSERGASRRARHRLLGVSGESPRARLLSSTLAKPHQPERRLEQTAPPKKGLSPPNGCVRRAIVNIPISSRGRELLKPRVHGFLALRPVLSRLHARRVAEVPTLASVQTCIVHLSRYCLSFCGRKERQEVAGELKAIYRAEPPGAAAKRLSEFDAGRWGRKYPMIAESWRRNWEQIILLQLSAGGDEEK